MSGDMPRNASHCMPSPVCCNSAVPRPACSPAQGPWQLCLGIHEGGGWHARALVEVSYFQVRHSLPWREESVATVNTLLCEPPIVAIIGMAQRTATADLLTDQYVSALGRMLVCSMSV